MSESNALLSRRFLIHGRVQGVFFRASTQRQAQLMGLTGHAINLPDGRVEVVAFGEAQAIDRLHQWLKHGPRMARVEQVEVDDLASGEPSPVSFTTG